MSNGIIERCGLMYIAIVLEDIEDWREGFLTHHTGLRGHFDHRWLHAIGVRPHCLLNAFAVVHTTAHRAGLDQRRLHGVESGLVDQRPDQCVCVERAGDAKLAVDHFQARHQRVIIDECMISGRMVVQRCPAVPTAEKVTTRSANWFAA